MMKLKKQGKWLHLEGKVDVNAVKALHEELVKSGASPSNVDVKGVEALDAAGVQWLWWVASKHGGTLVINNASAPVKTALQAAGLERWVAT